MLCLKRSLEAFDGGGGVISEIDKHSLSHLVLKRKVEFFFFFLGGGGYLFMHVLVRVLLPSL